VLNSTKLKRGASSRRSSPLYCPMWNSDQITIGKTRRTLIFQTKCKSEISFFSKISIFWAKYVLYNQCERLFISRWTENSSKRTKNELSRSTKRTVRRFNLTAKGSEMSFWISKIFWLKILARKNFDLTIFSSFIQGSPDRDNRPARKRSPPFGNPLFVQ